MPVNRPPPVAAKPVNTSKTIPKPPNANFRDLIQPVGGVPTVFQHIARPNVRPPVPPTPQTPPAQPLLPPIAVLPPVSISKYQWPGYQAPTHDDEKDSYEVPIGGFKPPRPALVPLRMSGQPTDVFTRPAYIDLDSAVRPEDEYEPVRPPPEDIPYPETPVDRFSREPIRKPVLPPRTEYTQNNISAYNEQMTPPVPARPRPSVEVSPSISQNGTPKNFLKSTSSIAQLQEKLGNMKVSPPAAKPSSRPLPNIPQNDATVTDSGLDAEPYFHRVDRNEAIRRVLSLREDGSFLVRPSQKGGPENPYTLSLVLRLQVIHLNIRLKGNVYALGKEKKNEMTFNSVQSMISHHRHNAVYVSSRDWNAEPVSLMNSPPK